MVLHRIDNALISTFVDEADFAVDLAANGAAYYGTLAIDVGAGETDTGSIAGSDHGGVDISAEDIIPSGIYDANPTNFKFIFPSGFEVELEVVESDEGILKVVTILPKIFKQLNLE